MTDQCKIEQTLDRIKKGGSNTARADFALGQIYNLPTELQETNEVRRIRDTLARAADGNITIGNNQIGAMISTIEDLSKKGTMKGMEEDAIGKLMDGLRLDYNAIPLGDEYNSLRQKAAQVMTSAQSSKTIEQAYGYATQMGEVLKAVETKADELANVDVAAERAATLMQKASSEGIELKPFDQNELLRTANKQQNIKFSNLDGIEARIDKEIELKVPREQIKANAFYGKYKSELDLTNENTIQEAQEKLATYESRSIEAKSILDADTQNRLPSDIKRALENGVTNPRDITDEKLTEAFKSLTTTTDKERAVIDAATLARDEKVPLKTRLELSDQLSAEKINDVTISRAKRESSYITGFDYSTIKEGTGKEIYNKIVADFGGDTRVADDVFRTKIENNIAEIDKILSDPNTSVSLWKRNAPTKDELKAIDDAWSGATKPGANTFEMTAKMLDKISDDGWKTLRGAIKPLDELDYATKQRIVQQGIVKGNWKKIAAGVAATGAMGWLVLWQIPNTVITWGMQQQNQFENNIQFGKWSEDQSSQNLWEMFLSDKAIEAQELSKKSADTYMWLVNTMSSLPFGLGSWYDTIFTAGGARASVFGFQTDADRVGQDLINRGLAEKCASCPWGFGRLDEDERTELYKKDPTKLFANDQKWIEKEGSKIYGTDTLSVGEGGRTKLTATQAMAYYYNSLGLLSDDDMKRAGITGLTPSNIANDQASIDAINKFGREHDTTESVSGAAAPDTTTYTDAQVEWFKKNQGLTDEQIEYRKQRGDTIVSDGKGGWKFETGTNEVIGIGPSVTGSGGTTATYERTETDEQRERREALEKTAQEKGFNSLGDAKKEAMQNYDTLTDAKNGLKASQEDLHSANANEYKRLVKGTIDDDDEFDELSKEDLDTMKDMDKDATSNALWNKYCGS
jgi:hypothetical protein